MSKINTLNNNKINGLLWKFYETRYAIRDYYLNRIISRHITMPLFGKEPSIYIYGGKLLRSTNWANDQIANAIRKGNPYMVSRFGNTELNNLNVIIREKIISKIDESERNEWWSNLYTLSGFFPRDEKYQVEFADIIFDSLSHVDILGVWNRPMEDFYLRTVMKNASITKLRWLEPWYSNKPWTGALEGKKVLVIHPFEKSIRTQYKKRELLFPDNNLLPQFELDVLKSIQTIGDNRDERFNTWFDALEFMYEEALKRDFDVAIIGCGAYGMPLAAKLKEAGKIAIHMGGVTQCLFGIKGKRWVESPIDKKIPMNEHWVYPNTDELPEGAFKVEGGCYW